jgi:hypothetical protein
MGERESQGGFCVSPDRTGIHLGLGQGEEACFRECSKEVCWEEAVLLKQLLPLKDLHGCGTRRRRRWWLASMRIG